MQIAQLDLSLYLYPNFSLGNGYKDNLLLIATYLGESLSLSLMQVLTSSTNLCGKALKSIRSP